MMTFKKKKKKRKGSNLYFILMLPEVNLFLT